MNVPPQIQKDLQEITDYINNMVVPGSPGSAPVPPPPENTVLPPYGVADTVLSLFALQWDGKTPDPGDNGQGAWGADTKSPSLVGCALPIPLLRATFGGTSSAQLKGYTVEFYSLVTQKSVLAADIVDEGPSAYTHRLADGTYGLHVALGHIEYGNIMYGPWTPANRNWPAGFHVAYWINSPDGKTVKIQGVDWTKNPAIIAGS